MKIAIPIENGCLHGHFGGCREFALVDADPELKHGTRVEILIPPEHQPGAFPRWLREHGAEVVIAGGIGNRALAIFAHHGIRVVGGVPNTPYEVLVAAFLRGELTRSPIGCEHHRDHHQHRHGEERHDHHGPHGPHHHGHRSEHL